MVISIKMSITCNNEYLNVPCKLLQKPSKVWQPYSFVALP